MEGRISGHTGLLALIGSPVGHSGSPAMYNYSFEKLGLDYAYVAFDIKEEQVKEALDAMKLFHMRGCNVTMPDKTEAAKHVDELSPAAQIIGAVNTIVNDDGKLTGYITDGEGFVHNLKDHGIDIKGKKITVAGGGGAATAIQVQCALDGAREITIFNIKDAFFERTLATAEKIRKAVPGIVVNVYDIADTGKMTEEIQSSDIFANATIVGMKPMEYTGESAKLETCVSLIASASAAGHKILLFSQFASMLERIRERLLQEGISSHLLVGATPKEERSRMVQAFASDEVPVFLISLKAGGTGLNLTAADIVIHYDPWWNVAAQNQATDRAYRIGQEKPVTVYKLILKDTIEENLLKLQNAKLALAAQVVSEGMVSLGDLSQNELMELFEQNP